MTKTLHLYAVLVVAFFTVVLFASYGDSAEKVFETSTKGNSQLPQQIRAIDLDRTFDFAGERLPMDNFDVRERLDRELMVNAYWHSSTILNIKSAHKFFPVIEKILTKNGVPDDLKYIAVAESGLRNVTSPAGAKGYWQFMKPVARHHNLEISSEVDERYHIEKATQAAAEHFKDLKKRFGTWAMAAAAYNMGGTRLSKEKELQRSNNYFDLNLNEETSRYVFRLVAIKEILNNPEVFGFDIDSTQMFQPMDDFAVVEVNEPVANWGDFAQKYGISYRMLKVYNPWLTSAKLTNKEKKTYRIKIPQ